MPINHLLKRCVLVGAILIASMSALVATPVTGQSFSAMLTPIAGLTQVMRGNDSTWQGIQEMTLVTEGDQLRTGSSGLAQLTSPNGVVLEVLPSTILQVNRLVIGVENQNIYGSAQLVGASYAKIKPVRSRTDKVRFVTPLGGIEVKGTAFVQFTGNSFIGTAVQAVFGEEGLVSYRAANGRVYPVGANALLIAYLPGGYLSANINTARTVLVSGALNTDELIAVKTFLFAFTTQYENAAANAVITEVLNLPPGADRATVRAGIDGLAPRTINMSQFVPAFITFFKGGYSARLGTTLAPVLCGNSVIDAGETALNCPDDATVNQAAVPGQQISVCGDLICQQDRGESVISCAADCFINAPAAQISIDANTAALDKKDGLLTPPISTSKAVAPAAGTNNTPGTEPGKVGLPAIVPPVVAPNIGIPINPPSVPPQVPITPPSAPPLPPVPVNPLPSGGNDSEKDKDKDKDKDKTKDGDSNDNNNGNGNDKDKDKGGKK